MNKIFSCRRTYIATLAIACLTALGVYVKSVEVASAISVIAVGLAGANAYEGRGKKDDNSKEKADS